MKMKVQVIIEDKEDNIQVVEEIFCLQRDTLLPESLGLTLQEGKEILKNLQQIMVNKQIEDYIIQEKRCRKCGRDLSRKGGNYITYRTLFGKLKIESPRLYTCNCKASKVKSFSPLAEKLPERTSPELLYLQSKWSSLMSYGLTVDLLEEILPLNTSVASTFLNTRKVANRIESELKEEKYMYIDGCERDWEKLPFPGEPLTVGIDGGYVYGRDDKNRKAGCFEVIVGKSMQEHFENKRFGFVSTYDGKPRRRLYEMLKSQGLQMNQEIRFLSDGGDTVRDLQLYMSPYAEHILDWFHITMRITVMKQMIKGLSKYEWFEKIEKKIESVKWHLWHGNAFRALQLLEDIEEELYFDNSNKKVRKLEKIVSEFRNYIFINENFIPNYQDRYHYGECISTAFVESTVNEVVSKRMRKKQQMRWTQKGAHLLLQVRTKTLNNELGETFQKWYPKFQVNAISEKVAA